MKRLTVFAVVAVLGAGCADRGVMDVSPQQNAQPSAIIASPPGNPGLTVMTWNVYYGTDPTIVLAAPSPDLIPVYAAQAWALLNQTNFPERAEALAQAIAANRPEIVGVQEAALWRIQETSDFNPLDPTPNAEEVVYDFLTLLTNALEARGQHYVVAAVDVSTDIEVPMVVLDESGNPVLDESGNPLLSDIRLTDRDAVLVRKGVPYSDPQSGVYAAAIPIELVPGLPQIYIREGWSSVLANAGGQSYRFVSTHLEIQDFPGLGNVVQVAQANELLNVILSDETHPTILVGDFNSDVASGDPDLTTSYDLITADGFQDAWLQPSQSSPGLTCCQNDLLSNPSSSFSQRVDFIFTRNMPQVGKASSLALGRDVLGDELSDRTAAGLWPSDHGAVVATFLTASPHVPWAHVAE